MPVTGPAVAVTLLNYGTTVPDHARCAGSRDGRPQAGIPSAVRKMKRKREEGGGFAPSLPDFALHRASGSKSCRVGGEGRKGERKGINSVRLENTTAGTVKCQGVMIQIPLFRSYLTANGNTGLASESVPVWCFAGVANALARVKSHRESLRD